MRDRDAFNRALSTIEVSLSSEAGSLSALGIVCPCGHVSRCEITGEMTADSAELALTCGGCERPRWIKFTREEQP